MIDFPASPANGQVFTSGGSSWTFDGTKWAASGTVIPPIVTGDNRIINGDMRIDQRNNGATGTATGYTLDRWTYGSSQAGKITWQRVGASPGGGLQQSGFGYCYQLSVTTPYTPIATDNINTTQTIEADLIADFAWGTPAAQPITLSFWVNASVAGTYSGAIRNQPNPPTRAYPFQFTLNGPGWTKVVVTIPGDTAGAWVLQGNAGGLQLAFDLGVGANYRTTANAWAAGNYVGVTGAFSLVAAAANSFFQLTGVKLEVGNVATPFNRQSLAQSLIDCERYYQQGLLYSVFGASIPAGNTVAASSMPKVNMRAPPTMTIVGSSNSNFTVGTLGVSTGSSGATQGFWVNGSATATAAVGINVQFVANAEL